MIALFLVYNAKPVSLAGYDGGGMPFRTSSQSDLTSTTVFTVEQNVKIVTLWFETKSYMQVSRQYCQYYNVHTNNGPSNGSIQWFV